MKNKKKNKFKNLFIKLKKTNKIFRFLFITTLILYVASVILFSNSLLLLTGIETFIRITIILLLYINIFLYLLSGLLTLITKKHKLLTLFIVLTIIYTSINSFAFYYINKTYNIVNDIKKEKIIYTINLVSIDNVV